MQEMPVQQIQSSIKNIVLKLQNIDLKKYEEATYQYILNNLQLELTPLFDEWQAFLNKIDTHYAIILSESNKIPNNNIQGEIESSNLEDDIDLSTPISQLSNTIAIAKWDYEWKVAALTSKLESEDSLSLLLSICNICSAIFKGSQAIEETLCNYEAIEPDELFANRSKEQLIISLEIRRVYTKFSKMVSEENWANDIELTTMIIRERLRRIGSAIAVLYGRDVFSHLRVSDRVLIKQLQQRILNWLSNKTVDLEMGKTIWQDVCSFAELLTEINNRAELIQHDNQTLSTVYDELASLPDFIKPLPDNLFTQLKTAFGRNGYLDQLIQQYKDIPVSQWKKTIHIVKQQLTSSNSYA